MDKYPVECRFCAELTGCKDQGKEWFRCRYGRFDMQDQLAPGRMIPRYFAWSGVWKPNKTVAAAQKDCPHFEVHPEVIFVGKKGSPLDAQ